MHGYKYPQISPEAQKTRCCNPLQPEDLRIHRSSGDLKMLCCRCLLPVLALYLLLEEISAAVLPGRMRDKREVGWPDEDLLFSRLFDGTDWGDLSAGDVGEMGRGIDRNPSHSDAVVTRQDQQQHQYQHHRKGNEKRRKVPPLDPIGSFQMSTFKKRKGEPDVYWEDYRD